MSEIDFQDQELVRKIIASVFKELGDDADPGTVKKVVRAALDEINAGSSAAPEPGGNESPAIQMSSSRIIVTAFGKNRPGVVAAVTGVLAKHRCNIEDISQKILQDYFALILIVDISDCPVSLRELKDELGSVGNRVGARVLAQHEDVFKNMHRI